MSYAYIQRTYGVAPRVGQRVRFNEGPPAAHKLGTVAREDPGCAHYVMVRFDGKRHASPCHPRALDYDPQEGADA